MSFQFTFRYSQFFYTNKCFIFKSVHCIGRRFRIFSRIFINKDTFLIIEPGPLPGFTSDPLRAEHLPKKAFCSEGEDPAPASQGEASLKEKLLLLFLLLKEKLLLLTLLLNEKFLLLCLLPLLKEKLLLLCLLLLKKEKLLLLLLNEKLLLLFLHLNEKLLRMF